MELLTTSELLARTGVKRSTYDYLREKYGSSVLVPVKRAGYALLWQPQAATTLMSLAAGLRKMKRRKGA